MEGPSEMLIMVDPCWSHGALKIYKPLIWAKYNDFTVLPKPSIMVNCWGISPWSNHSVQIRQYVRCQEGYNVHGVVAWQILAAAGEQQFSLCTNIITLAHGRRCSLSRKRKIEGIPLVGGLEHFLFSHILGIIIPIDFHIFQRGGPTTNQSWIPVDIPGLSEPIRLFLARRMWGLAELLWRIVDGRFFLAELFRCSELLDHLPRLIVIKLYNYI